MTTVNSHQFSFEGVHDGLLLIGQVVVPDVLLVGNNHQRLVAKQGLDVVEQALLSFQSVA